MRPDENAAADRTLTDWLYAAPALPAIAGNDLRVGGVRMLRALGFSELQRYHMNEGHAALLALELLRELHAGAGSAWGFDTVRNQCVFTTHTPGPAGHDRFPYGLVREVVGDLVPTEVVQSWAVRIVEHDPARTDISRYVNGVAKKQARSRARCSWLPHQFHHNGVFTDLDLPERPSPLRSATPGGKMTLLALRYASAYRISISGAHTRSRSRS